MNPKFLLLLVAVVAIGIFVLPETVAMFSGQHNFYDTTQRGNQVPCEKCHADINVELQQPGQVNSYHKSIGCDGCHVIAVVTYEGKVQGSDFHAAAMPMCMDCHDGSAAVVAGGLDSELETHTNFINGANSSNLMRGQNEACIGCHTHTAVNITWTTNNTMNIIAVIFQPFDLVSSFFIYFL